MSIPGKLIPHDDSCNELGCVRRCKLHVLTCVYTPAKFPPAFAKPDVAVAVSATQIAPAQKSAPLSPGRQVRRSATHRLCAKSTLLQLRRVGYRKIGQLAQMVPL